MAQLVLVNSTTYRDGINEIGDVVGIFDDTHQFSEAEQSMFTIISVTGDAVTLKLAQQAVMPETKTVFKSATTDWTDTPPTEKTVWDNDGTYYELADRPKYITSYDPDAGVFSHNYSRSSDNTTTAIAIEASIETETEIETTTE